jgi:DNA-binding CsgD family transcriptional regulator
MLTARFVIQVFGWAVGIPLEILVIIALLHYGYRRYPVVFIYLVINFIATVVDIPMLIQSFVSQNTAITRLAAKIYWINEWVLQVLIFATVLSLIDLAISMSRWRRVLRAMLTSGALLFAGITFWIQYQPPPVSIGVWMTPWTADLSVAATVLCLALWMILIASPKSDRTLMLICGALGMQFTAEAIGEAIADLSVPGRSVALGTLGSVVAVAGNLICLYVWWRTFRSARPPGPPLPERRERTVLSGRETEVLRLLVQGMSNVEIGARMDIPESAVKNTMQQLFGKTGVRTRSQLVRVALEEYRNEL